MSEIATSMWVPMPLDNQLALTMRKDTVVEVPDIVHDIRMYDMLVQSSVAYE